MQIRTHTDMYRHKKSHKHVVSSMGQEHMPQKDHLSSNFTDTIKHTTPLVQSHKITCMTQNQKNPLTSPEYHNKSEA